MKSGTPKTPNPWIISIEETKETQYKSRESIFSKSSRIKYPQSKERDAYQGIRIMKNTR